MPARKKKTIAERLQEIRNNITSIVFMLGIVGGIATGAWNIWAVPKVNKQIDLKIKPQQCAITELVKGQEYTNYLLMSTLDSAQLHWANEHYKLSQRLKGKNDSK